MVKMESVWHATAGFLRANFAALLPIAAGGILLPATIGQLMEGVQSAPDASTPMLVAGVQIVIALVTLWAQVAIMAMAITAVPVARAASLGLRRLPAVIGVGLILAAAVLLLSLPILIPLWQAGLGQMPMRAPHIAPMTMVGIVLYAIFLIALAVFLFSRLVLVTPVLVAERAGIGAIRRSWRLTRGYAAAIIGVVLLYLILAAIVQLAVKTVMGSLLLLLLGGEGAFSAVAILIAVATGAIVTVLTVVQAAFLAKLYVALAQPVRSDATHPA